MENYKCYYCDAGENGEFLYVAYGKLICKSCLLGRADIVNDLTTAKTMLQAKEFSKPMSKIAYKNLAWHCRLRQDELAQLLRDLEIVPSDDSTDFVRPADLAMGNV